MIESLSALRDLVNHFRNNYRLPLVGIYFVVAILVSLWLARNLLFPLRASVDSFLSFVASFDAFAQEIWISFGVLMCITIILGWICSLTLRKFHKVNRAINEIALVAVSIIYFLGSVRLAVFLAADYVQPAIFIEWPITLQGLYNLLAAFVFACSIVSYMFVYVYKFFTTLEKPA